MIKRIMKKKIGRWLARIVSYFYCKPLFDGMTGFARLVKSEYMSRKFKSCGKDVRFFSPYNIVGEKNITIDEHFTSDAGLVLQCWDEYEGEKFCPEISIGKDVFLGKRCHIAAINKISIGDNLLTGSNVNISDHSHGKICQDDINFPPIKRRLYTKGEIIIGNNVWLGDNVCVLPGVTIGDNVIVGANSVVTKDIETNTVAAGVPAKEIKKLEDIL